MTTPNRPRPVKKPVQKNVSANDGPEKPYALVSFPQQQPTLDAPIGHHRYAQDCYHGTLYLTLKVQTALHVSTGITALGKDVGSKVPLIKTMVRGKNRALMIQGSSLKGCVRAIYEAITNSTLGVITKKIKDKNYLNKMPKDRWPYGFQDSRCNQNKLCPASLVFGALDWQGLVKFSDAECQSSQSVTGFMPSLYRPRPDDRDAYFDHRGKAVGRKFYYHAAKAVSGGEQGIPVQQAGTESVFKTRLQIMNLAPAQLGAILIALGQDKDYPMALKLGGGKPIGMGTVKVFVTQMKVSQGVGDRYAAYAVDNGPGLTGDAMVALMQEVMQTAKRSRLIELPQLQALADVLQWPTTRTAPEGEY
ncbi:MAG: CRISPR-associated protein [Merismopedia sp. SIO2A8]|nr:CRISPR-associated protein [Symploca sp. SIO2B6]NET49658.1 CRISPR-associated protein [Merismopedia sp. SIO2A8]